MNIKLIDYYLNSNIATETSFTSDLKVIREVKKSITKYLDGKSNLLIVYNKLKIYTNIFGNSTDSFKFLFDKLKNEHSEFIYTFIYCIRGNKKMIDNHYKDIIEKDEFYIKYKMLWSL